MFDRKGFFNGARPRHSKLILTTEKCKNISGMVSTTKTNEYRRDCLKLNFFFVVERYLTQKKKKNEKL